MAYDESARLHVLFGSQFTDDPHTWVYDVRRNEWRDMRPHVQPPTDKNDAVLGYDPIHRVVLAIVKITTGMDETAKHELQTWAYNSQANRWQRMNPASEPESSGNRARQLIFRAGAESGDSRKLHQPAPRTANLDVSFRGCSGSAAIVRCDAADASTPGRRRRGLGPVASAGGSHVDRTEKWNCNRLSRRARNRGSLER